MAEASISVAQDQFSCSICLDLLKDPVTIPCGHSYCMNCITEYWNRRDLSINSCPQCRQTFTPKPALNKNVMLAEMVEKVKAIKVQTVDPAPSYAGPGDVECDVCNGRKRKAVKSCLVCLESYCQCHYESHEESRSKKRHKITDATRRIQDIICSKHDRLLEVYCHSDKQCICLMCVMDEHKNHDIVSAEAERAEKQKQVEEMVIILQNKIQKRQKQLQYLRTSMKHRMTSAQRTVEHCEKVFSQLIQSIERSRSEVTQMIRDREKEAASRAKEHAKLLELELDDLKRRNSELEKISHTDDHIYFLQNFQSVSVPPGSKASGFFGSYFNVKPSLSVLQSKVEDFCKLEMEKFSAGGRFSKILHVADPKTREDFLQYSHQFTLNSESVHNHLSLSEGKRGATFTSTLHQYPDHLDRFDVWPQVLCKEIVCGRCYWEVEWSGNHGVGLSVSYKTICRKGRGIECKFGSNDQSWRLFCSASKCIFSHNNDRTELPVVSNSRIGVYVDQRAGILSFFSVSDSEMSLIHRIQTTFTQPLHPGFILNPQSSVKLCNLGL
ncbi:E3 ubiquitin/ISG15 ligase TRIM25 [Danio rerio]|uniref:E3 ubiquitin/ISG15 ligase TRIM25 n=1 Tax=Danio rerio TaxID=7955 RepID=A0AC58HWP4_DANRE|nr:tripartite motif-containing protein 16 [Danio rerio]|eukprot:XP_689276.1 tripartite motif-containing protein 16 [Danio rerio]